MASMMENVLRMMGGIQGLLRILRPKMQEARQLLLEKRRPESEGGYLQPHETELFLVVEPQEDGNVQGRFITLTRNETGQYLVSRFEQVGTLEDLLQMTE